MNSKKSIFNWIKMFLFSEIVFCFVFFFLKVLCTAFRIEIPLTFIAGIVFSCVNVLLALFLTKAWLEFFESLWSGVSAVLMYSPDRRDIKESNSK